MRMAMALVSLMMVRSLTQEEDYHQAAAGFVAHELTYESYFAPQGCESKVANGDRVTTSYKISLDKDGSVPIMQGDHAFVVGAGEVIKGWEDSVENMCKGEKRKATIPPTLAFGENGVPGQIPPSATIFLDVEMIDIVHAQPTEDGPLETKLREFFDGVDTDGNGKLSKRELIRYYKTIVLSSNDGKKTKYTYKKAEEMYFKFHGPTGDYPDRDGDKLLSFEEWNPSATSRNEL